MGPLGGATWGAVLSKLVQLSINPPHTYHPLRWVRCLHDLLMTAMTSPPYASACYLGPWMWMLRLSSARGCS